MPIFKNNFMRKSWLRTDQNLVFGLEQFENMFTYIFKKKTASAKKNLVIILKEILHKACNGNGSPPATATTLYLYIDNYGIRRVE